jgi:acetoacetate decarboxylase
MARDVPAAIAAVLILPLVAVIWAVMIVAGAVLALGEWIFDDGR